MHEAAAPSGATINLLHVLRYLKANGNRPFSVVFSLGGTMSGDFANVADVWIAERSRWCPGGIRSQVMKALGIERLARRAEQADLRRFVSQCPPALIYLSAFTTTHLRLLDMLDPNVPVLTHVRELEYLIRRQTGPETPRLLKRSRRFIASSGAVKRDLIQNHGVTAERVDVVHGSVDLKELHADLSRADLFRQLGFPEDAQLVVGCGTTCWRKGVDLFSHVARIVCRRHPRARFVWVGPQSHWRIDELEYDARMTGVADRLRFTGPVNNPATYFAAADVFALTSREEAWGLVALESAALGKPIVCFAEVGGMLEFVEDDCGYIVPYLDVDVMADRIISLLDCPGCREKMGAAARRKAFERHDISVAGPRFMDIIDRTIAGA